MDKEEKYSGLIKLYLMEKFLEPDSPGSKKVLERAELAHIYNLLSQDDEAITYDKASKLLEQLVDRKATPSAQTGSEKPKARKRNSFMMPTASSKLKEETSSYS